jgi:hypothetical protein
MQVSYSLKHATLTNMNTVILFIYKIMNKPKMCFTGFGSGYKIIISMSIYFPLVTTYVLTLCVSILFSMTNKRHK